MKLKEQIGNSFDGMVRKAMQEVFEENMEAVQKATRCECADSWEKYARKLWGTKRIMTVEEFVAEGRAAIIGDKHE